MTKTIVEVETDAGISGIGEAADGDRTATILRLRDRLIGVDPLNLNECEHRCVPDLHYNLWERLTAARRGFGAIEMALWDLRARAEGRPLHALLGGAVRNEIEFTEYFSFRLERDGHGGEQTAADIARYCARMVEEYDSPTFEGKMATVDLNHEIRMVREVREAIGAERMLRLDANGGWTVPTARGAPPARAIRDSKHRGAGEHTRRAARAAPAYQHVVLGAPRRSAAGRRPGRAGLLRAQPRQELGGIRRTVEFVRACEMFGIGFWFHSGDTGVATAAYLQVSAALEPIREPSQALLHWTADDVIQEGPFCPRRGRLPVPQGPGLGVNLDRVALERCHQRYLQEGEFPSGMPSRPEATTGSFGGISRF